MTRTPWTEKKCVPCKGGVPTLTSEQVREYLKDLEGWKADDLAKSISVRYTMKHFMAAVDLIQKVAGLAESEDHHPDIHLTGYRQLQIVLSTHAIGGLSENDFIIAAKINQLPKSIKPSP